MTQLEIFLLIGLFSSFFATGVIFFTHKKQASQVLDETHRTHNELYGEAMRIISKLEGQLMASQKANDKLSTEKTAVLQQYNSTATLLDVANKKHLELLKTGADQQATLNKKIIEHQATIRELELQLNQIIGHYQAETQRNLQTEYQHITDSLEQLSVLEQKLTALNKTA